jgi:cell division protein FtsI (penicillin-binding protein 3)
MMPCADGRFPGRTKPIKDLNRVHSYLDLNMAIQKSSNIYMSRLAQRIIARLGDKWYRNALQNLFGFGVKCGIELPSESAGVLPTPGKLHPNGALEWSVPTPYSLAMGHNIQATSIQMLRAWAVIANGGRFVKPTLIKSDYYLDFPVVLDKKIIDRVIESMRYTTKPGGSGRRADIFGYTEVGKTGTADKIVGGAYSKTTYIASFMGFSPVDHPAFVLLVSMDEPESHYIPGLGKNHGSLSGAPVFKEIARRSLEYLGVTPDDPYGYPIGDPRYDPKLADWVRETQLLQEKYEKWNNK